MLQIKQISKQYRTGDLVQQALDGVDLNLRDNEFVAILGPSGSGKTTLLNIIGGLDRYDSGDLIINGISTKKYKDRDWDSYRNHTIGFVFQSYNLIPHQSVLQNVELALTIGGISKRKRRKLALDALEKVGLREQAHKKPNQMSGGQMQRVAIARALVNDPKILLADEPTGALDTNTSLQVMDLLKEVAKDRLVVMVTHNPELAEKYATRVVRLKDGVITDDSDPLRIDTEQPTIHKNLGKASMSLPTAFGLSLKNLLTKKGRTVLTAFAGSIGIIGIALILSLSAGFQNYVDQIQEDTMTSYPLMLTAETTDFYSMILTMQGDGDAEPQEGTLVEQQFFSSLVGSITSNDLKTFKAYLESHEEEYADDVNFIKYTYSVTPVIYTIDAVDNLAQINPNQNMASSFGASSAQMAQFYGTASMGSVFAEMTSLELTKENNELLYGRWPEQYNEMIAVVTDPNQISDLLLYSLGFRDTTELRTLITDMMMGEEVEIDSEPMTITYDDLIGLELKLIDPTDKYAYNEKYDIYEDMSADRAYMEKVYNEAESLHIVGIACSNQDAPAIAAGILYMPELTNHVIAQAEESEIVKKQMANKEIDVFSGNAFDEVKEESGLDFQDMISIDEDMIAQAFNVNMPAGDMLDQSAMQEIVMASAEVVSQNLESTTESMVSALKTIDEQVSLGIIQGYIATFTMTMQAPGAGAAPETPPEGGDSAQPGGGNAGGKSYLVITVNGIYMPDIYIAQALSDEALSQMAGQMEGLDISTANLKKIAAEAFDNYISSLSPNEMGMVPIEELPDPNEAVATAISNNEALIFEEGYSLAKAYTSLLVAQGIGQAVAEVTAPMSNLFSGGEDIISIDADKFAAAFNFDMNEDELSRIMAAMLSGSDTSYSNNLLLLGYQDLGEPTSISIYFNDFESKGNFMDFMELYNKNAPEAEQITYTDLVGLLMGSVETIINSVTYVLIAFVSISLVVSSIMIGIITYISVLERTKEIGILRAIGASKRNVSSIFNAETFIIGLLSGLIGIGMTYALNIPINLIIHSLMGNDDITAVLPAGAAVILVVIATGLTIIGGLLPSRSASKKDPVIALRSE